MPLAYQGEPESVRRKFERDKEELKKLGLELEYSPSGQTQGNNEDHVYMPVEGTQKMPEIVLSQNEYRRLSILILAAIEDPKINEKTQQILQLAALKLFYKYPIYLEKQVEPRPKPLLDLYNDDSEKALETIHEALKKHKPLKIHYSNKQEKRDDHIVSGRGLISHKNRWCLVGYCHKAKDIRRYYVDRILKAEITQDEYQPDQHFDIRKYSLHPLSLPIQEKQRLQIETSAEYTENFRYFISGAKRALPYYEERENSFVFETPNPQALFTWMLLHPDAIAKIGPEAIRQGFQNYLKELKEMYNETSRA